MDFVSCLYYRKIVNCIVLVVISFSSSSAAAVAATDVKCLFCVSTANCCCIGLGVMLVMCLLGTVKR